MRILLLPSILALCLSSVPALAQSLPGSPDFVPPFENVKVGEAPGVSRVIVICGRQCAGEKQRDGRYYLAGISGALDIDMSASGKFVSGLSIENLGSAALLTVDTADEPIRSEIAACGSTTICVDLYHPAEPLFDEMLPASTRLRQEVSGQSEAAAQPQRIDRKALPEPTANPAASRHSAPGSAEETNAIYHEALTEVTACTSYYHQLQRDAWDMVAYKKTALCAASAGDIARARALFERYLLAFPDDEEALVALASLAPATSSGAGRRKASGVGSLRYGF